MKEEQQQNLQDQLKNDSQSAFSRYQSVAIGNTSIWYLIKYEIIMLLVSGLPGALGLVLRKILYPSILGSVGKGVIFGRGMTIRHGLKVHIGDNVTIDDLSALDAKGSGNNGIQIGDGTILSRNVVLSCKDSDITVGSNCALGINSLIHAAKGSPVVLGDDVLCGAYCYFIGGGSYATTQLEVPFKKQGALPKGGIAVENNVWIGSNVQIMDGCSIDTGSIIGSSAVVNKNIVKYSISAGIPAKLIRKRV